MEISFKLCTSLLFNLCKNDMKQFSTEMCTLSQIYVFKGTVSVI